MTKYMDIDVDYSRDSLFDDLGLKRLKESYMKDDENSPQERYAFVSRSFGSDQDHAQRLYEYSSKHWLSYSTPILSFGRTNNGLPISCFLSWIPDTAKGLVDTLSETNWLSMLGGGVGLGFGIRSAGEKSTGVMPHLKIYDASSLAFKQGSTRRGSYAAYLNISHPDVLIFLEMRKPTGDQNMRCLNLHHGINISDQFMKIIEKCMLDPKADDSWELKEPHTGHVKEVVSAKELWQKILELRMQTGEPYLHFIDTSNAHMPSFLKDKGLKIRQSNLCVSGDQRVPTNFGMLTAKELCDMGAELTLASNNGAVKATSMRLIERDADTFTVTLENGMTHTVTPYHKILSKKNGKIKALPLENLSVGDSVAFQNREGLFGKTHNPSGAKNFASSNNIFKDDVGVPQFVWSGDKQTQVAYISEVITNLFNVKKSVKNKLLELSAFSSERKNLSDIQIILLNLGVKSSLKDLKSTFGLFITNKEDLNALARLTGIFEETKFKRSASSNYSKISSIQSAGKQDVYCVGVHTEDHLWICNGVVTHNCSEIILPTSDERTAVCCLSSLNLETYEEWKDDKLFLRDVAEMLDNVLTYFINNAPDSISRAKFSAMRERSIGIGALGFHAYLQRKGIPFESALAKSINIKMFRQIREALDIADIELGKERGEAPDAVGTGKRFSHMLAIAPNACVTGDTSIILADGESAKISDVINKMGFNHDDFEYLDIELDDGTIRKIHVGQSLTVSRDGETIQIIGLELKEDDDIIGL